MPNPKSRLSKRGTSDSKIPNTYSPSVPISLYRELAAELQAARSLVENLSAQNQYLVQQNQQLRQEITDFVRLAKHSQHVIDAFGGSQTSPLREESEIAEANFYTEFSPETAAVPASTPYSPQETPRDFPSTNSNRRDIVSPQASLEDRNIAVTPPAKNRPSRLVVNRNSVSVKDRVTPTNVLGESVFIEQESERKVRRGVAAETSSEVNSWLLAIIILTIVLTAFGTGFLFVRPLLKGR